MTDLKIFGLYGTEGLTVSDKGLNRYISFESRLVIKSRGRNRDKFSKAKTNIVERLIGELSVPGHRGKKHKIMTKVSGKYTQQAKVIMETLKIISRTMTNFYYRKAIEEGIEQVQKGVNLSKVIAANPRIFPIRTATEA